MPPPVEIHPSILFGISPYGEVPTHSMGSAKAGSVFPSIDGSRFLNIVMEGEAYFIQTKTLANESWKLGRVFKQRSVTFSEDVNQGGVAGIVNVNLSATKSVLSDFLDIYMGCMAVAGGPTAMAITGMNTVVAGGKIKHNYSLYCDALAAFVGDNQELSRLMPYFHENIYMQLFLGRIESELQGKTRDLITGAIPVHKAVKPIVGVFIGKVGEDAMKRTLRGTRDIIKDVLLKVIDHILTKNETLTSSQIDLLAEKHIVPMYEAMSGIQIPDSRAREIIKEAAGNPTRIRPRLVKIARAIDALHG
ncbi:MAG TPA: hypothetical protein PKD26_02500 [Pyrinomonadaceae bacterium]|nr:hypothetical protein [Pyrinomonadaceae bacterium]